MAALDFVEVVARVDAALGGVWRRHQPMVAAARLTAAVLLPFLQSTGAVIAGSFVLQALFREDWGYNDVDIFVPIHRGDFASAAQLLQWCARKFPGTTFCLHTSKPEEYVTYCLAAFRQFRRFCGKIVAVINGDNGLQLIFVVFNDRVDVTYETMISYIHRSFDLKICAAAITHNGLRIGPDGIDWLLARKSSTTRDVFLVNRYSDELRRRIQKYLDRGFTIVTAETAAWPRIEVCGFGFGCGVNVDVVVVVCVVASSRCSNILCVACRCPRVAAGCSDVYGWRPETLNKDGGSKNECNNFAFVLPLSFFPNVHLWIDRCLF
jgi:hypothetical protein